MHAPCAILVTVGCLALGETAYGQRVAPRDHTAARAQIALVIQEFAAALKAGDPRAISELYTADGINVFDTESRGRQAIQRYWIDAFLAYRWEDVTVTSEELTVVGDTAYDFGVINERSSPSAGGPPTTQRLRYFAVWKRQPSDHWKIHRWVVAVARLPN